MWKWARVRRGLLGVAGSENEANRHAWLERVLADVPAGSTILDAGAGEGRHRERCKHLVYTSQDFGLYDGTGDEGLQPGAWDTSRVDLVCDITEIPVPDRSFDAVLCTEVLEHVPRPHEALEELARVLKPGGRLILTAPFACITHFAPYFYSTGFSRHYYEAALTRLGMELLEISENGNYFTVQAQELRRLDSVARTYGGGGLTLPQKAAVALLVRALGPLTERGGGSRELASFGLHVLARRPQE
jgi:SAM-dependent methyltransferase